MEDYVGTILSTLVTVVSVVIAIVRVTGNAQKEANNRHIKLIEAIGSLESHKVSHSVCEKRQKDCPCYTEIKHVKEDIKELKRKN
ncbi:hypothetical protein AAEX28_07050 [Lentisphaerota bacterium WC36G]|nr:hypothetical protein LJT99_09915 [Lentisphaerae bacterium WC36]UDQ98968.1 hypothetical protein LJT99_05380 [Lentisphaerae bacterium WC36]UDQ99397.1 hypothetical protein LJT99_07610 [Lentisphaerae bacterium WC36]